MIILNDEMAYINWYLAEKEYPLTTYVREALNMIDWLIRRKRKSKTSAIYITIKKFKKKYTLEFSKELLWRCYNQRKAYIKNAKDKFKIIEYNRRIERMPEAMKLDLCACGCGHPVKPGNKYICGHNIRCRSKEKSIEQATHMRKIRRQIKLNQVSS